MASAASKLRSSFLLPTENEAQAVLAARDSRTRGFSAAEHHYLVTWMLYWSPLAGLPITYNDTDSSTCYETQQREPRDAFPDALLTPPPSARKRTACRQLRRARPIVSAIMALNLEKQLQFVWHLTFI